MRSANGPAKLFSRSGRLYRPSREFPGSRPRHGVKLKELVPFWAGLSPIDRQKIARRMTFEIADNLADQRSAVVQLDLPITIKNKTIYAIRLKGISPNTDGLGVVRPYTEGQCFSRYLLGANREGQLIARKLTKAEDYSAHGTMTVKEIETEVRTALKLGAERTDLLLGIGQFGRLLFNQQAVGFVVYGLTSRSDTRLITRLKNIIWRKEAIPEEAKRLARQAGRLAREAHRELNLLHGSLNLGNFSVPADSRLKLVDLDNAQPLPQENRAQRIALLYLDLAKMIVSLQNSRPRGTDGLWLDGELAPPRKPFTPLLPFFLAEYFCDNLSLRFVKRLNEIIATDAKDGLAADIFGTLPNFSYGYKTSGTSTLADPYIELFTAPAGTPVNLQSYRNNRLFDDFFEALERTLAS